MIWEGNLEPTESTDKGETANYNTILRRQANTKLSDRLLRWSTRQAISLGIQYEYVDCCSADKNLRGKYMVKARVADAARMITSQIVPIFLA